MSFFTYKRKLIATVLFYDKEIIGQKQVYSRSVMEICRVIPDTTFFQMTQQLNVNFSFANVTFTKKSVSFCVCVVFMCPLITKVALYPVLVKRLITNDVPSFFTPIYF
jgi:hypothetical protein